MRLGNGELEIGGKFGHEYSGRSLGDGEGDGVDIASPQDVEQAQQTVQQPVTGEETREVAPEVLDELIRRVWRSRHR